MKACYYLAMKTKFISLAVGLLTSLLLFGNLAYAQSVYSSGTVGSDVSWPNCGTRLNSLGRFGIIGVNDGEGYSTSPCIAKEASYYSNLSLYANSGWYSGSSHVSATSPKMCATGDENCLAYNYGYNGGLYAYNAAKSAGVKSANWWIDVENGNTWSTNTTQNQNSIQGEHDALVASGAVNVGIYSTTAQWDSISGSWQNNWPGWGATTVTSARQAATYCSGHRFTGGPTWLIQFQGSIDQDYAC
jgi:hypothetical protein